MTSNSIERVSEWVEKAVVGMNLCPFAKPYTLNESIKIFESKNHELAGAVEDIFNHISNMEASSILDMSNVLIVYPKTFVKFEDFVDLINVSTEVLEKSPFGSEYQLAYFHPEFVFEGSNPDDKENFTARAPYPVMHILRSELVEAVRKTTPDIEDIPLINSRRVASLSLSELKKVFTSK
jgi:uncharacterized protein